MSTNEYQVIRAVESLRRKYPQLTIDGLQCAPREDCTATIQDIVTDAIKHLDHIDACRRWLAACPQRKTFNTTVDTYTYKHEVEGTARHWVSHASMIIAVEIEGFEMKPNPLRPWAGLLKLGARRPV